MVSVLSSLRIYTNNPLLEGALPHIEVVYRESSAFELLLRVRRELIEDEGYELLNHPLHGSIQVKNSPYMSLVCKKTESRDTNSILYLSTSLLWLEKRSRPLEEFREEVLKDFQYIDKEMIVESIESLR